MANNVNPHEVAHNEPLHFDLRGLQNHLVSFLLGIESRGGNNYKITNNIVCRALDKREYIL